MAQSAFVRNIETGSKSRIDHVSLSTGGSDSGFLILMKPDSVFNEKPVFDQFFIIKTKEYQLPNSGSPIWAISTWSGLISGSSGNFHRFFRERSKVTSRESRGAGPKGDICKRILRDNHTPAQGIKDLSPLEGVLVPPEGRRP